jgi:tetratricopeptide (TPR) repeat protein
VCSSDLSLTGESARRLAAAGHHDDAQVVARAALLHDPADGVAWLTRGRISLWRGEFEQADHAARHAQALGVGPRSAWRLRGEAAFAQRRFADAVDALGHACAGASVDPEAWQLLPYALESAGRAGETERAARLALLLHPADGRLAILAHAGRTCRAPVPDRLRWLGRAARRLPDLPGPLHALAVLLRETNEIDRARAAYRAAILIDPTAEGPHLGLTMLLGAHEGDGEAASRVARAAPTTPATWSNMLLAMSYDARIGARRLAEAHRGYAVFHPSRAMRPPWLRAPHEALRVGFVSSGLREHATGYFLPPLLRGAPRRHWKAHIFSTTPGPGDHLTARLRPLADHWHDITALDDDDAHALIRRQGIDILIDMNGHTADHRLALFARRPAPIQATWLDYVHSTGLPEIDFLISDANHIPPGEDSYYTETVLRLPHTVYCYAPLEQTPNVGPAPSIANGHITFGCFNVLYKVSHAAIDAWSAVLRSVPGARMVLSSKPLALEQVRRRILGMFAARGIEAARLDLLGPTDVPGMLARYGRVDLALDSFPYSGGLTTLEGLWMGVPVVTFPGDRIAGRHSTNHLRQIGLTDFIARDREDFVRTAIAWAGRPAELAGLRRGLRALMAASPLRDEAAYALAFSTLLLEMPRRLELDSGPR